MSNLGRKGMVQIRELRKNDMQEVVNLKIACWTEELAGKTENSMSYNEELEFWTKWMETAEDNNDIRVLIGAFKNGVMLGVAIASLAEPDDIPEGGIELNGFWVYPEHRGKGIGLKLLVYLLNYYMNVGLKKIVVYSHRYAPSNQFYRKFGAQVSKQVYQMKGKLLIDVFTADILRFKSNLEKTLHRYV